MAEERNITDQVEETDDNESSIMTEESGFTRRDFLQQTMAVASGLALGSMLPSFARNMFPAEPQACTGPAPGQGQTLQTIMEIKSAGTGTGPKTLQAVLKILDEQRTYYGNIAGSKPPKATVQCGQMRYISGYDMNNTSDVWPKTKGVPSPGPTLRASVGDTVQITLLNQVNTANFPGNQLDVAEYGTTDTACAEVNGGTTYPGKPTWETLPNCFHGSSSTNLHFHGTHISPSGIADNILINLRPSPRTTPAGPTSKPLITEQTVAEMFKEIFAKCTPQTPWPMIWNDWPADWQSFQKTQLISYDNTAPWRGQSPPPGGGGPPVLPQHNQLWWQDQDQMANNLLPQFYIGAFPYCFTLPKWNGQSTSMGQAPGTHWYHAHKHGSTAINLANGMAGALIIEGDYDATLKKYYSDKAATLNEKVLVLQQISVSVGLLRPQGTKDFVWVNGQYQPVIEMKPNETQFWRIVNACHQQAVPLDRSTALKWVQTAQDGVQLDPQNYDPDPTSRTNTFPNPPEAFQKNGTGPWFSTGGLAPGNRIDLLVQAPSTPNTYPVTFGGTLLFTVRVTGTAVNPTPFPSRTDFPEMPKFLWDIVPPTGMITRNIRFNTTKTQLPGPSPTPTPQGTTGGRNSASPTPTPPLWPNAPPTHTINGKQFSGEIDQYMKLGATEEWNLFNDAISGGPAHPFHIHVNPFQIVRWFDPAIMPANLQSSGVPMRSPWIWWDNFAIPVGGWVTMWTRFVDFTGPYVFHCHILGHEDRGMMQLVNVSPGGTPMTHK
jgi:FtsP/CotA-like multicopper oxidase with cupredoxin domain